MDCLICGTKIPALYKLFFKQSVGIECQNCHSILSHDKHVVFLVYLALVGFIGFLVVAIAQGGIWWAPTTISVAVLAWLQWSAPLKVIYENKHHK
jgi:hypothetical protein